MCKSQRQHPTHIHASGMFTLGCTVRGAVQAQSRAVTREKGLQACGRRLPPTRRCINTMRREHDTCGCGVNMSLINAALICAVCTVPPSHWRVATSQAQCVQGASNRGVEGHAKAHDVMRPAIPAN